MDIAGKVAVITGGASGLGEATTERFHSLGAKVAIFDLNDEAGGALAKRLGDNVAYFNVNVTDEDSVAAALRGVKEQFGDIHICCNYAGIGTPGRTLGRDGPLPLEYFKRVVDVNLIGTFNVLRLVAEQMATHDPVTDDGCRGVIINTASVAAYEGQIGQAAYSASKGGVVGMTLPIARDLSSLGIRVNTIAPGVMATPLMLAAPQNVQDGIVANIPFPQRLGAPAEFGQLVVHIAENSYLNGETIRLDGGVRMQPR